MGITKSQFPMVWRAIKYWMGTQDITPAKLSFLTGYSEYRIENGLKSGNEWIPSDFLHSCLDVFRLRSSRQRGIEDTTDVLTDEECIEILTAPLGAHAHPRQGELWG